METREPLDESLVQGIVADCMQNNAVIIGATNRSLAGFNNTLCLSPALISTKSDMDEVISAIDGAMGRVLAWITFDSSTQEKTPRLLGAAGVFHVDQEK